MSRISPTGRIISPWSAPRVSSTPPARAQRGPDSAEISAEARQRSRATDGAAGGDTGVRRALVARVKAQIAAGTYETDNKIDAILDKLAADLVS